MQLTGELSQVGFPNLLQLVKSGELTGKIAISQGARSAIVQVAKGDVVHAEAEMAVGREAVMELFLWLTGSYAVAECPVAREEWTLNPKERNDSFEVILKDGLTYLEQRKYLEQLRITSRTVLVKANNLSSSSSKNSKVFSFLDGTKPLADVFIEANVGKREAVEQVYRLLINGEATVRPPATSTAGAPLNLPDWVVARLQHDNPDISRAIVDMVIWVDRVKCWMYQADADFAQIIKDMEQETTSSPETADSLEKQEAQAGFSAEF